MDAQNHFIAYPFRVNDTWRKIVFLFCVVFCLTPYASPAIALLLGIALAQTIGPPYLHPHHKATHLLLQVSVVGLGFGMNLHAALQAGKQGLLLTVASIAGTLLLGYLLSKMLKIGKITSFLISAGTAICGGSAIAAISPVIKAKEKDVSIALGCVFVLNAAALFVFPLIGHSLHLSQTQFGLWCAIAIHDTSSVIAAAAKFGPQALAVATTVKLARALWIIPISFISPFLFKTESKKIHLPYFIGLFILGLLANTYIPFVARMGFHIVILAKSGLTLTLFLIGSGLSRNALSSVGFKPFLQGIILWVTISVSTLLAILYF